MEQRTAKVPRGFAGRSAFFGRQRGLQEPEGQGCQRSRRGGTGIGRV